jgi:plastocyanin
MNRSVAAVILVVCTAIPLASVPRNKGVIAGRVVITKVLTKHRVVLPMYQLRGVSPGAQELVSRRNDAPGFDEFSRVVIYLQGPGLDRSVPVHATLTQKSLHFQPEIVVIPAGSTVSFPNEDPIFHNVFSLSRAKQFDLGYYPKGQTRVVRFDRPGVVQVYCHIHADMHAAILVVPTAWWTRLTPEGSFSLKGIPPGTYELVAWHYSAGFFRRRVVVNSGERLTADFMIPVRETSSGEEVAGRSGQ